VVIGLASLGGAFGFFAGVVVGLQVLGIELADGGHGLSAVAAIGAGIGWFLGAITGHALSMARRPAGRPMAYALWVGAGVVLITGLVLCALEAGLVGTYGIKAWELSTLRAITIGDATLAAVTIVAVSRTDRADPAMPERQGLGAIALAGVVAGGLLSGGLLLGFLDAIERNALARTNRAAYDTGWALLGAAERYQRRAGTYPKALAELLSAGANVRSGAQVEFAGTFANGFCIVVGADIGEERAGEPRYTAFTWPEADHGDHVFRQGSSCRVASARARHLSR
jgi:hypothetical protein